MTSSASAFVPRTDLKSSRVRETSATFLFFQMWSERHAILLSSIALRENVPYIMSAIKAVLTPWRRRSPAARMVPSFVES